MLKLDNAAIAEIAGSGGFFYLGTSYTRHDAGIEEAARMASRAAGLLISKGVNVFSPISHSHPIAYIAGLNPVDHDLWMRVDKPMMEAAEGLIVLLSPCWVKSRGLAEEIAFFRESCLPIYGMEYVP